MLQAWIRGKRRGGVQEFEDEIVSAIFGSLCFLHDVERAEVVRHILAEAFGVSEPELGRSKAISCSVDIELWPNIAAAGRVEPDVVFKVHSEGVTDLILILEAKWNASQSEGQLKEQWHTAKQNLAAQDLRHLFLTKGPNSIECMLGRDFDHSHAARLVNLTWCRFAAIANRLAGSCSHECRELKAWSEAVRDFLSRLGQFPLTGVYEAWEHHMRKFGKISTTVGWRFDAPLIDLKRAQIKMKGGAELPANSSWSFKQHR